MQNPNSLHAAESLPQESPPPMTVEEFDAALEKVTAYLSVPPAEGSEDSRRFYRLLEKLRIHRNSGFGGPSGALNGDEERLSRLNDALTRASAQERKSAFGDPEDGIGPTLGMDLS